MILYQTYPTNLIILEKDFEIDDIEEEFRHIYLQHSDDDIILIEDCYGYGIEPTIKIYYREGEKIYCRKYDLYYSEDHTLILDKTKMLEILKEIRRLIHDDYLTYYYNFL